MLPVGDDANPAPRGWGGNPGSGNRLRRCATGSCRRARRDAKGGKVGGGSTDVVVSSLAPDSATQGLTLDVTIAGSGFTSDMDATWELDGIADPAQVRTNKTTYVSSKQLIANITIAPDATPDRWDIRVMSRGGKGGIGIEMFKVILDGTSDWLFPTDDAGLDVQSDRQNVSGGYSVYADGHCNVTGWIFLGGSGDAKLETSLTNTGGKGKCGRTVTLRYPDGASETFSTFANVRKLALWSIPPGHSDKRTFAINPGTHKNNPNRCGLMLFGRGDGGRGGQSDSLLVSRIDARTWEVRTQDAPKNLALCDATGELYPMRMRFLIRSRVPLP
jgi:hypothetical protein